MATRFKIASDFLGKYSAGRAAFVAAASELEGIVSRSLHGVGVPIHLVTARAKAVNSLRRKLRRKIYRNPATQVTDLIAVRVIVYFGHDIDRIEVELRSQLEVSERKSRDARKALAEDKFGYRSVHLIARLRPTLVPFGKSAIGRRWFEVQIRSILDHAWSEIEHEAVYKSGVVYPLPTRRRFKALAAALEVLEDAFSALSRELDELVRRYHDEFAGGAGLDAPLDVARLFAFLEFQKPSAESWRSAERAGRPFPAGSAAAAVEVLLGANIRTARELRTVLGTKAFNDACATFAAKESIAVASISHLAIVVLAAGATKAGLVTEQFPEMVFSPSVAAAMEVAGRTSPRKRARLAT